MRALLEPVDGRQVIVHLMAEHGIDATPCGTEAAVYSDTGSWMPVKTVIVCDACLATVVMEATRAARTTPSRSTKEAAAQAVRDHQARSEQW